MGRMTKTDELTLAAEFPQATYEDWRKLVDEEKVEVLHSELPLDSSQA